MGANRTGRLGPKADRLLSVGRAEKPDVGGGAFRRARSSDAEQPRADRLHSALSPVLADRVPSGDGWLHELKHDGFRIIARKEGDHVRLGSRNGRDWSAEFVAITAALRQLPADFVLDGEAVAHCSEGLPDFHGLLGRDGQRTACLYAFDLLHLRTTDPSAALACATGLWVIAVAVTYYEPRNVLPVRRGL
jgi:ATP-dependent DNA ligase